MDLKLVIRENLEIILGNQIFVTGDESLEKFSLVQSILDSDRSLFFSASSENSLDINRLYESSKKGKPLYYPWHIYCMTYNELHYRRQKNYLLPTIFIICWDFKQKSGLYPYLSLIRTYSRSCPIFIAITRVDLYSLKKSELKSLISRAKVSLLHFNINDVIPISFKEKRGIPELIEKIFLLTKSVQSFKEYSLKQSELKVVKKLVNQPHNGVSYEEYQKLCKLQFISDPKLLIQLLHELGIVVGDSSDLRFIITKPKWFLNFVEVLQKEVKFPQTEPGLLPQEELLKILCEKGVQNKMPQETILNNLISFSFLDSFICPKTVKVKYLCSASLSETRPSLEPFWTYTRSQIKIDIQRFYRWYDLPFIPKIIHNIQKELLYHSRAVLIWKDGIMFEHSGDFGLIEAMQEESAIIACVHGHKTPQKLISIATDIIESELSKFISFYQSNNNVSGIPLSLQPSTTSIPSVNLSQDESGRPMGKVSFSARPNLFSSGTFQLHQSVSLKEPPNHHHHQQQQPFKVEELVPCSHCAEAKDPTDSKELYKLNFFPIKTLKKAVSDGVWFVSCNGIKNQPLQTPRKSIIFDPCATAKVSIDLLSPNLMLSAIYEINYSDLQIEKTLGVGSFGSVFKAKMMDGATVAVKTFDTALDAGIDSLESFRRECFVMSSLEHPNVIKFMGYCLKPLCLVMEYLPYSDLHRIIKSPDYSRSMSWKLKVVADIANGIAFLHSLVPPLIHCDLKSSNILLAGESENETVLAKIVDFGLSFHKSNIECSFEETHLRNPTWLAPEVLKKKEVESEKSDIYSFGLILYEIFTGKYPFDEYNFRFWHQTEDAITNGIRPTIDDSLQPELTSLIKELWDNDPEKRPTATQVLQKLDDINHDYLLEKEKRFFNSLSILSQDFDSVISFALMDIVLNYLSGQLAFYRVDDHSENYSKPSRHRIKNLKRWEEDVFKLFHSEIGVQTFCIHLGIELEVLKKDIHTNIAYNIIPYMLEEDLVIPRSSDQIFEIESKIESCIIKAVQEIVNITLSFYSFSDYDSQKHLRQLTSQLNLSEGMNDLPPVAPRKRTWRQRLPQGSLELPKTIEQVPTKSSGGTKILLDANPKAHSILGKTPQAQKLETYFGIETSGVDRSILLSQISYMIPPNQALNELKTYHDMMKTNEKNQENTNSLDAKQKKLLSILGVDFKKAKLESRFGLQSSDVEEARKELVNYSIPLTQSLRELRSMSTTTKPKAYEILGHSPQDEKVLRTLGVSEDKFQTLPLSPRARTETDVIRRRPYVYRSSSSFDLKRSNSSEKRGNLVNVRPPRSSTALVSPKRSLTRSSGSLSTSPRGLAISIGGFGSVILDVGTSPKSPSQSPPNAGSPPKPQSPKPRPRFKDIPTELHSLSDSISPVSSPPNSPPRRSPLATSDDSIDNKPQPRPPTPKKKMMSPRKRIPTAPEPVRRSTHSPPKTTDIRLIPKSQRKSIAEEFVE